MVVKRIRRDLRLLIAPQSINQSIILFSDAGYKVAASHEADVDLQLTNKMWNNKKNNLWNQPMVFEFSSSQ